MTSDGLGRCLKVTLQTCPRKNFRSCRWGPSGESSVGWPGSEDPHQCERKFLMALFLIPLLDPQFLFIYLKHKNSRRFWMVKLHSTGHSIPIVRHIISTYRPATKINVPVQLITSARVDIILHFSKLLWFLPHSGSSGQHPGHCQNNLSTSKNKVSKFASNYSKLCHLIVRFYGFTCTSMQ